MNLSSSSADSLARKSVALLLIINLLCYLDRYLIAAVLPDIINEFLPGDPNAYAKAGLLTTAFLVTYMITAPLFGWLADRFSRWLLIGISVAVWSLACGASGLAGSFFALLLTRVFLGIGEGGYGPAAPTILSDLFPVHRRGFILSCFYIAIPVGSALGYLLGGFISHYWSWHWAFFLMTPPGLILAFFCFFMKDPREVRAAALSASGATAPPKKKVTLADYKRLLKIPSLTANIIAQTALTFSIGGLASWVPTYLNQARGFELKDANFYFGAISAGGGLISTLLGGLLADRLRSRFPGAYFLVSGCGMLLGFPAILGMIYFPFPMAWIFVFLAIFFLFLNTGPSNTALANVTPPAVRATAFAVSIFVIHAFGDALSPPLLGWIRDHSSWDAAFLTVSAVTLVAGVIWICSMKALARDTAAMEREEAEEAGAAIDLNAKTAR